MAIRTIVAVGATAIAGAAQADLCSNLQQQYNSAGYSAGTSTVASASDISALNRSLNTAQASADANNCSGGGFFAIFGPRPSPACGAIMAEVNRLQSAVRDAYRGGGGQVMSYAQYGPSRDQIRSQMAAYGCPVPGSFGPQYSAGGYRTLCVRTCDGYYFPLEYGVSSDRFQADAQACQSMYGAGTQAQLFVMPSDGDVADATPVSGGGKPYGTQPYAFAYRSSFNPSCAAQLQSGVATLASTAIAQSPAKPAAGATSPAASAPAATASGPPVPIPQLRRTASEDPETAANVTGALKPTRIEPLVASTVSPSGFRIVGAGYFNQILDQQAATGGGQPLGIATLPPTP